VKDKILLQSNTLFQYMCTEW